MKLENRRIKLEWRILLGFSQVKLTRTNLNRNQICQSADRSEDWAQIWSKTTHALKIHPSFGIINGALEGLGAIWI
jgi:hypothetical protein